MRKKVEYSLNSVLGRENLLSCFNAWDISVDIDPKVLDLLSNGISIVGITTYPLTYNRRKQVSLVETNRVGLSLTHRLNDGRDRNIVSFVTRSTYQDYLPDLDRRKKHILVQEVEPAMILAYVDEVKKTYSFDEASNGQVKERLKKENAPGVVLIAPAGYYASPENNGYVLRGIQDGAWKMAELFNTAMAAFTFIRNETGYVNRILGKRILSPNELQKSKDPIVKDRIRRLLMIHAMTALTLPLQNLSQFGEFSNQQVHPHDLYDMSTALLIAEYALPDTDYSWARR